MKLIGIVGRAYTNIDGNKIIQTYESIRKWLMKSDDITCITILPTETQDYIDIESGKDTIDTKKLDYVLDKCDGFIIPGGTYYYNLDEYVIKYAIKNDKPLLAICLGFQALCSMFAKNRTKFYMTTKANLSNHIGNHNEYKHKVIIQDNTLLSKIINKSEIMVNSIHHDIVDFKMNNLIINTISDDGVIEGVEYPNKKFIMGLQWHPESINDENSIKILNEFIRLSR